MKKLLILTACALVLCGCAAQDTFETVGDEYVQSVMQSQRTLALTVEEGATTLQSEAGTVYLCDGYTVTVEVCAAGDLSRTLQNLTGYEAGELTVMTTASSGMSRYECAWACAGEGGDAVGRAVIWDDGAYHYCVSILSAAEDAQALLPAWNAIFDSVSIS